MAVRKKCKTKLAKHQIFSNISILQIFISCQFETPNKKHRVNPTHYLSLSVDFFSEKKPLRPPLAGDLLSFCWGFLVFCKGACFASSFGELLDLGTEDGRSASVGDGLGFTLLTKGGDLVKKLKMLLCLDIVIYAKRLAASRFYHIHLP